MLNKLKHEQNKAVTKNVPKIGVEHIEIGIEQGYNKKIPNINVE